MKTCATGTALNSRFMPRDALALAFSATSAATCAGSSITRPRPQHRGYAAISSIPSRIRT